MTIKLTKQIQYQGEEIISVIRHARHSQRARDRLWFDLIICYLFTFHQKQYRSNEVAIE